MTRIEDIEALEKAHAELGKKIEKLKNKTDLWVDRYIAYYSMFDYMGYNPRSLLTDVHGVTPSYPFINNSERIKWECQKIVRFVADELNGTWVPDFLNNEYKHFFYVRFDNNGTERTIGIGNSDHFGYGVVYFREDVIKKAKEILTNWNGKNVLMYYLAGEWE